MKISFVTTGDIEDIATSKRAFGLAEPLTQLGYEVSILAEDTANNRQRMGREAPSARALWFQAGSALQEVRRKCRILREYNPDIIYVSALGIRNLAWSPSLARNSHYIVEHSELASSIKSRSLLRRIVSLIFEQFSLLLFDGHVTASRFLERYIVSGLMRLRLKSSVHYSPYAYSSKMLVPDSQTTAGLRREVGARKMVVYMGTLSKNYGIIDIVHAFGHLRKSMPDVVLFILGKGRDLELTRSTINDLELDGVVFLKGYVSDEELPSYLELADVFIAPLFETVQDIARCPSKLFLYLPFNRPIVTSAIGEAKALLGDYDFYYAPGDVGDMADVLRDALCQPADWRPPWIVQDHSWVQRARDLDKWLQEIKGRNVHLQSLGGPARFDRS